MFCFHSLIISFYIYRKAGSTCKEAAILHHNVSTVAQYTDLFKILWFTLTPQIYPNQSIWDEPSFNLGSVDSHSTCNSSCSTSCWYDQATPVLSASSFFTALVRFNVITNGNVGPQSFVAKYKLMQMKTEVALSPVFLMKYNVGVLDRNMKYFLISGKKDLVGITRKEKLAN